MHVAVALLSTFSGKLSIHTVLHRPAGAGDPAQFACKQQTTAAVHGLCA
jgi:hypothetical protein